MPIIALCLSAFDTLHALYEQRNCPCHGQTTELNAVAIAKSNILLCQYLQVAALNQLLSSSSASNVIDVCLILNCVRRLGLRSDNSPPGSPIPHQNIVFPAFLKCEAAVPIWGVCMTHLALHTHRRVSNFAL